MKRTLLFLLVTCWSVIMMAGNVTPEEALQQATKFMKERVAKGVRRAPAAASSLTMAKDVCGLYVVNVGQSDGFIIVSPDDRTDAILGYSDNGTLDPDNMPENMRAWLQGYADEIKWLNEHNYQPSAKARRVSPVKPAIDPLMKSHWDQDEPFNNLCPEYASGKKSATGCVATAMAQAMYYNQWPTAATAAIPEYTWREDKHYGALPSTTFDWDKMLDDYTFSYNSSTKKYDIPDFTSDKGEAVAKLMEYCGHSLKMNYGPESSASTAKIPNALKTFFDYASTVEYVNRTDYTYANWIELMYDELTQGRVVVYRGKSTGGGHAFICDGYQGEDYFHINWGWGGTSDDYFKLSVVNPYEQGIGGSSSDDGFYMGQGAVVGIQKNGASGTVNKHPGSFNLNANNYIISDSPTQYQNVDVTMTISNSGIDTFEDEIGMDIYYKNGETWGYEDEVVKSFVVPASEEVSCKLTFVPTKAGQYIIRPFKGNSYIGNESTIFEVAAGSPDPVNPTSDEIALTSSLVVDNSAAGKFFGTTFKGTLTIANPETSTDYCGWYEYAIFLNSGGTAIDYVSSEITIPANSSINVPIEFNDLSIGTTYMLLVNRYLSGTSKWNGWQNLGSYTCTAGVISFVADGTKTISEASGTSYNAPSNVLAVDLTGTNITTVSGGATNCLFISDKNSLTGATNFIKNTSGTYTAANITLTDGNDFYTPVDFTATNIEFTYNNDRWANGTNGWNTIMLPFDVTSVTANGTAIDWFHSGSDTGKQFWLKQFIGDDTTSPKVSFDYVSGGMKANTPYIIALPGNHWGDANDLSGKTIKFIGSGEIKKSAPAVVTASNYRFVGNTKAVSTENIYCINDAGNQFVLKATGGSAAFRPFFKPEIFDRSVESLSIGGGDGPTAIQNIKVGTDSNVYFDLNGRRVLNPTKGVYIKNGNKVVIK